MAIHPIFEYPILPPFKNNMEFSVGHVLFKMHLLEVPCSYVLHTSKIYHIRASTKDIPQNIHVQCGRLVMHSAPQENYNALFSRHSFFSKTLSYYTVHEAKAQKP
jgi:hypothetical protein